MRYQLEFSRLAVFTNNEDPSTNPFRPDPSSPRPCAGEPRAFLAQRPGHRGWAPTRGALRLRNKTPGRERRMAVVQPWRQAVVGRDTRVREISKSQVHAQRGNVLRAVACFERGGVLRAVACFEWGRSSRCYCSWVLGLDCSEQSPGFWVAIEPGPVCRAGVRRDLFYWEGLALCQVLIEGTCRTRCPTVA